MLLYSYSNKLALVWLEIFNLSILNNGFLNIQCMQISVKDNCWYSGKVD